MTTVPDSGAAPEFSQTPAGGAVTPCSKNHGAWIEIVVVGVDGSPAGSEAYEIVGAGDAVAVAERLVRGARRVAGLAAGKYSLRFPDLDQSAISILEKKEQDSAAAGGSANDAPALDLDMDREATVPAEHEIVRHDGIARIAMRYGFAPDFLEIKDADGNPVRDGDLRVGDTVQLPSRQPPSFDVETGQRYAFVLRGVPPRYRSRLLSLDGSASANVDVVLETDYGKSSGNTDNDGWFELFVSPKADTAVLKPADGPPIMIDFGAQPR